MTDYSTLKLTSQGLVLETSGNSIGDLKESNSLLGSMGSLREQLQEEGYLFIRNFYEPSVVQAAQECVLEELLRRGLIDRNYPVEDRVSQSKEGIILGKETYGDSRIQNYLFGEGVLNFFKNLLGGEVARFDYTWLRAVGANVSTKPHADIVYMGRGTHQLYTTWVPYFDTPFSLGGLMVLEGSHKAQQQERLHHYLSMDVDEYCVNKDTASKIESGEQLWEHNLEGALSNNPVTLREKLGGRWLTADFKAGDVMIFGMKLIHGSIDNQTNQLRVSSDTRYQLASEPIDERWIGENPIAHGIAGKKGKIC